MNNVETTVMPHMLGLVGLNSEPIVNLETVACWSCSVHPDSMANYRRSNACCDTATLIEIEGIQASLDRKGYRGESAVKTAPTVAPDMVLSRLRFYLSNEWHAPSAQPVTYSAPSATVEIVEDDKGKNRPVVRKLGPVDENAERTTILLTAYGIVPKTRKTARKAKGLAPMTNSERASESRKDRESSMTDDERAIKRAKESAARRARRMASKA